MHTARYLLLNPRYRDPMQLESPDQVTPEQGLYPVRQPHLHEPAHMALRLIDLTQRRDIRERMMEWVADETFPRDPLCGWLVTDEEPWLLRHHLELWLLQHTTDGRKMLFCYFVPAALDQMIHILDAAQLRALMGPIQRWTVLDADRRALHIERPEASGCYQSISNDQWQAIGLTGEIDHIRCAWQALREGEPLPDDQYQRIATWLSIASDYGLTDNTDRIVLALLGLVMNWRFDLTRIVQDILARHRGSGVELSLLFKRMTAAEWTQLEQSPQQRPIQYEV